MNNNRVYAEDINYWQTSQVAPDTWIEKAKKEIARIGGKILGEAFGADGDGKAAFMLRFIIGGDHFEIRWTVLPTRGNGKEKAAKIQAATLLYHDVKHKVVMAKVKGVRASFLEYLMLPNGQNVGQAAADKTEFFALAPQLMIGSGQ